MSGTASAESAFRAVIGGAMLYWALVFFLASLVAAIFGFGGVALAAAGVAKLLFCVFIVLSLITLASHLTHRPG